MLFLLTANPAAYLTLPAHLGILGGVVALAAVLTLMQRAWLRDSPGLRLILGWVLVLDTLGWYAWQAAHGQMSFPGHLPLELCDFTLYLTIAELFTLNALLFDLCYYLALAGTSMALFTPNLWERFPSVPTVQFFIMHGLVVSAVLYLACSGLARPRRGSVAKAMLALNIWAILAGSFDWAFRTNYMYLRHIPENPSLLNFMGPWPWYIGAGEIVAVLIFLLLYWPYRRNGKAPAPD